MLLRFWREELDSVSTRSQESRRLIHPWWVLACLPVLVSVYDKMSEKGGGGAGDFCLARNPQPITSAFVQYCMDTVLSRLMQQMIAMIQDVDYILLGFGVIMTAEEVLGETDSTATFLIDSPANLPMRAGNRTVDGLLLHEPTNLISNSPTPQTHDKPSRIAQTCPARPPKHPLRIYSYCPHRCLAAHSLP